jgi:hypothetical protein
MSRITGPQPAPHRRNLPRIQDRGDLPRRLPSQGRYHLAQGLGVCVHLGLVLLPALRVAQLHAPRLTFWKRTEPRFAPRVARPRAAEGGKEIWREVVGAFRSDWFQGCEAILSAYCSTVTTERQLAGWITEHGVEDERWLKWSGFTAM